MADVNDPREGQPRYASMVDMPAQAPRLDEGTPGFTKFAEHWFAGSQQQWRRSYRITQRGTLDKHLIAYFGDQPVGTITRDDVLRFRAHMSTGAGRRKGDSLSGRRINAVMETLRLILDLAAIQYGTTRAFQGVRPLPVDASPPEPFTADQVRRLLEAVRRDYWPYLTVRVLAGLRTAEVHGLKWTCVDFAQGVILIRTVLTQEDRPSQVFARDVWVSEKVDEALRAHRMAGSASSDYVFHNRLGGPISNRNFIQRVWSPLLSAVGLPYRAPSQMRHTAAALWLAEGRSPSWVAAQLGGISTRRVLRLYEQFLPRPMEPGETPTQELMAPDAQPPPANALALRLSA